MKSYRKIYKMLKKGVKSTYSNPEEYHFLLRQAEHYGLKPSVFQKQACLNYGKNTPLPDKEEKESLEKIRENMASLIVQSKRANTLTNQWTKHANTFQRTSSEELKSAAFQYRKLSKEMEELILSLRDKYDP